MDKKNTTIGIIFLVAGFAWLLLSPRFSPPAPPAPAIGRAPAVATSPGGVTPVPTSPTDAAFAAATSAPREARDVTLENEFVEVRLTSAGGAVRDIALKKHKAKKDSPDPYVINAIHAEPALSFVGLPGLDSNTLYELVSSSATEAVFRTTFEGRLEVTRRYILPAATTANTDPYQLRHETTFRNLTGQTALVPGLLLSAGTAAPVSERDLGNYLVTGSNIGGDISFINRAKLQGGGLFSSFGLGSRDPIPRIDVDGAVSWAAVNNQFFTSILTPDKPAAGMVTRRVQLAPPTGALAAIFGINGAVKLQPETLAPNAETKVGFGYYAGPKDYHRLSNIDVFKADQDKVMQFSSVFFIRWCAQLLLTLMVWMHGVAGNWGVAIILATLTLKIVFLYPTLSASRSAKRMQKIQPELQGVREKFKDNPQKMQAETMAIFKKHRINPAGGCLPILITMPFFFGFYSMLQSNADLRFAEFLWAKDLSASDTVLRLWGVPLNIMPLLLGATMIVQMRLVPTPSVDNMQVKMMKFMPWMFTFFCYNLPVALSLYSTINGLFTIGQQLVINRTKDEPPPPPEAKPGKPGKPLKNVTPKR